MSDMQRRLSSGMTRDRLSLEIKRASRPLVVYLVLVGLALGATAVIAKNINVNFPWQDTYRVRLAVDDAKGVVSDLQEVRISGVRVGAVSDVELVDGRAVLTLVIDSEYGRIYRDARVRIRPQTPVQDLYVNVIDRGTPQAGELSEREVLSAGRTETPVQFGDVMNVFDPPTRERFNTLMDELGRGLGDRGAHLRTAFAELAPFLHAAERLSETTAQRRRETRRLVRNFRLITEELARRDRAVADLVADGEATFGELAANDEPLAAAINAFPPTMRRLQSSFTVLREALRHVDPALVALRPAAEALPSALESLKELGTAASPALTALRPPIRALVPVVTDLAAAGRDLEDAFARLRPQAPHLDHVVRVVARCEPAIQKFFHWTPSVFKFGSRRGGAYPRGESVNAGGGPGRDPTMYTPDSCTQEGRPR